MRGSYTWAGLIIVFKKKKTNAMQIFLSKYRYKNIMRNQLEIKKKAPFPHYITLNYSDWTLTFNLLFS